MTIKHNKVLLTGASGFIAIHTLKLLLERGYTVKATVRSQAKGQYLLDKFPGQPIELAIVEDIRVPGAFDKTLEEDKEITAVLHTASPFFTAKEDPLNELLIPALEGTKNILSAIKKHAPQVTSVVITSSFAAILDPSKLHDHSTVFSESTWSPITWEQATTDLSTSYRGSKTFAEKEFWRFIKEESPNFTGTTVNPPAVFGPLLQDVPSVDRLNTSNGLLYHGVFNPKDGNDFNSTPHIWVDVRDVALAHILPLEKPELAGKRLFVTAGFFSLQSVLDIVNKDFPELQGKIPVGEPGTGLSKVPNVYQIDNHVTNELLGIKYHTLEETVKDTFKTLIELKNKVDK
ncbi:uncharacterized protein SAPINGB_P000102 [Magnusiomyces paraingens]|uniref:NAD-dependent epimerase/dehydratase domain-containing protein n=1 Tax=Magnusiomyces paraingens TaxID=2606893 RepID=A0A5E8B252_9ASCO|nr:uncharacterized protein SAPINGB_P000102 [Saprochaete ingens]VVT43692.1 unnamed protein product [Saprochaete ingens]